jgi:beta-glucosidase
MMMKRSSRKCLEIFFNDGSNLEDAKALAKMADAVVLVVGYNHDDEG